MAKVNNSKNNTPMLVGLVILAIILVGGLLYLSLPKQLPSQNISVNITNTTQNLSENSTIPIPICDDSCLFSRALISSSFEDCAKINSTTKQQCFVAISNSSFDACTSVLNYSIKKQCINKFALSRNSTSICDELVSSDRSSCKVAVDSCFGSSNPGVCYAFKFSDPTRCQSDEGCLLNYAQNHSSVAACELIQNRPVSLGCKSAISHNNFCGSLSGVQSDLCLQVYGGLSNDKSICQTIQTSSYSLSCFANVSVSSNDSSVCDNSQMSLNDRWTCHTSYSLSSGDISGCDSIPDLADNAKFQCAFQFAKKFGDPSSCQIIDSISSRIVCYQGSIIYSPQTLDYRKCSNITNYNWMNKCYLESAKTYSDISLCDLIEDTSFRQTCIDAYNTNHTSSN